MKTIAIALAQLKLIFLTLYFTVFHSLSGYTQIANDTIRLLFVDHLKAGFIEQDVFVEKIPGSGQVYRILPSEREKYLKYPVYTTAKKQEHDPIDPAKCGPYQKGKALPFNMKEWLQAKGTATYICEDGWTKLHASFENLIPNAVYTMWHVIMAKPPVIPFTGTLNLPIGERDGSQSVFRTDENGNATLAISFDQCLELGNLQTATALAIAYHSDGKTYKGYVGPFGSVSHVQLFARLPDIEYNQQKIFDK